MHSPPKDLVGGLMPQLHVALTFMQEGHKFFLLLPGISLSGLTSNAQNLMPMAQSWSRGGGHFFQALDILHVIRNIVYVSNR